MVSFEKNLLPGEDKDGHNRLAVMVSFDSYEGADGGPDEKLAAIKDDTERIQVLLKDKYGYEIPSEDDFSIFEPGQFENQDKLVATFEMFLQTWKEKQPVGRIVDRFLLYFHGHGVQVLGHPCLLTSKWTAIPLAELVNLVAKHINPNRYYLINDCCANNKVFKDEKTRKRMEKATNVQRAQDFG